MEKSLSSPTIVAIDGPSASGKGTLARKIASHYNWLYLDTGVLYRAMAYLCEEKGVESPQEMPSLVQDLTPELLKEEVLRSERIGKKASLISLLPEVREVLLEIQRAFPCQTPGVQGVVMDGRDIGTVIFPQAQVKLFITASLESRAQRRTEEMRARGEEADYQTILQELQARDERDKNRQLAPLKPAPEAEIIDTTHLTPEEAFQKAIEVIERKAELF